MLLAVGSVPAHPGASVRRVAAGLWLALVLSGFFLYLGAIDLLGIEPSARTTGPYYLLLAAGLLATAWSRRDVLRSRLRQSSRTQRTWLVAAALLAGWFLVTATLRSDSVTARDASFLLVAFCLPSALAALSFRGEDVRWLARGLVALGLVFALVSVGALIRLAEGVARFTPIDELDPISAATTAVMGAIAALTLRPASQRGRVAQWVAVAALVATAIIPGSRGPLLALGVAVAVLAALAFRRVGTLLPAVAAGVVLGLVGAELAGSTYYLGVDVPGIAAPAPTGASFSGERLPENVLEQEPISSTDIRSDLLLDAIRAVPDRPLTGHGVGMLRADSEGIRRMVRAGRIDEEDTLTHPHNALVEAAYSLGLPGLLLLLTLVVTSALALLRLMRDGRERQPTLLAVGVAAAVAISANLSGELGTDAWLWVALALPVALSVPRPDTPA
jgi:O-antigen ligase